MKGSGGAHYLSNLVERREVVTTDPRDIASLRK